MYACRRPTTLRFFPSTAKPFVRSAGDNRGGRSVARVCWPHWGEQKMYEVAGRRGAVLANRRRRARALLANSTVTTGEPGIDRGAERRPRGWWAIVGGGG